MKIELDLTDEFITRLKQFFAIKYHMGSLSGDDPQDTLTYLVLKEAGEIPE